MKRKFSRFCEGASVIAVFNPFSRTPASRSTSVSPLLPNALASLVPLFRASSDWDDHHITSLAPPTSLRTRNNWVYATALHSHRHLTTTLSWYTTPTGRRQLLVSLHIIGGDDPLTLFKYKVRINPCVSEQNRGQELTKYESSQIAVVWDFSQVKYYDTGLEPVDGFSLLVLVDSQAAFLLGDVPEQCSTVFQELDFTLVSRAERALSCKNERLHGIEARLTGKGPFKDVLIQCRGMETEGLEKCPVLYVYIGKELVLQVRKLHWNFRGMQTKVLADGLEVEIAWDVQAWLFREEKSDAKGTKNLPEFATFALITPHGSSIFHC